MTEKSVAILGVGGIGGFLSAVFWRAGFTVTCIPRHDVIDLLAEGVRLESVAMGDFIAHPRVMTELSFTPDFVIIAVKAVDLPAAMTRLPVEKVSDSIIIPLLNGFEHFDLLRNVYGPRVTTSMIGQVEAYKVAPNHIRHTTVSAHIDIAAGGLQSHELRAAANLFSAVNMSVRVVERDADVIWGKLVRLNAIACLTAATQQPIGFARSSSEWRHHLENCVTEAAAVAQAHGASIDPALTMEQIDRLPAGLSTSLQRDVAAGRPSELDAIAGAIVRSATQFGLSCPTIGHMIELIKHQHAV